jgi:mono/diheme cytochrome c family protein
MKSFSTIPGWLEPARAVSVIPYASRSEPLSYCFAVWRLVMVFRFHVKLLGILMTFLGSELVTVSGEQPDSTEKWTAPAAEARKKNPVAVTESSLAAGQKIYLKRCVACHGKTGNGDGPDAADLGIHPAKLSDPLILENHRRKKANAELWLATIAHRSLECDQLSSVACQEVKLW